MVVAMFVDYIAKGMTFNFFMNLFLTQVCNLIFFFFYMGKSIFHFTMKKFYIMAILKIG